MMRKERLPIVGLALICLLYGLWTGLNRMGWNIPVVPSIAHHGAIMVGGFLGTLIILEKVIPLKKKGLYLIPIANASSIIFFAIGKPIISISILIISSASLSIVFLYYFRRHPSMIYFLMTVGAVCWLVGNLLLLSRSFYPLAFPWWAAFALLVISAERLELMRFLPVSGFSKNIFAGLLLCFIVGSLFSFHGTGNFISAAALAGTSIWLMRNDMIAINLRKRNLPKFVATALLCGYIALLLTGVLLFSLDTQLQAYDAVVHCFFLGFVFSMIFAHGPIILPGVMGLSISPFSKTLYLWLFVLHGSLITRIIADVTGESDIRGISGLLSAVSIIGYFATLANVTIRTVRYGKGS